MSANYSHGLTYQCSNVSPRDGSCGHATVSVIARSRDLSHSALADVMPYVTDVCIQPSELRVVTHDGLYLSVFQLTDLANVHKYLRSRYNQTEMYATASRAAPW